MRRLLSAMRRQSSAPARLLALAILALGIVAVGAGNGAGNDGADTEWRHYSGDNGASWAQWPVRPQLSQTTTFAAEFEG